MALCDECINKENCGVQEFFEEGKLLLPHCINFVGEAPREIKTNFQRITASPEALAEFIGNVLDCCSDEFGVCKRCPLDKTCTADKGFKQSALEWLKQPHKRE